MRCIWIRLTLVVMSSVLSWGISAEVMAAAPGTATPTQILFTNVNIFDGKKNTLAMGQDVLVEGKLIKQIGQGLKAEEKATVIDGGGRTLMPGHGQARRPPGHRHHPRCARGGGSDLPHR